MMSKNNILHGSSFRGFNLSIVRGDSSFKVDLERGNDCSEFSRCSETVGQDRCRALFDRLELYRHTNTGFGPRK